MLCRLCFFILLMSIGFYHAQSSATEGVTPDSQFAGRIEMNGSKLKDFGDFTKDWKLVTVRYREDTKEMRFTYANDVALSALQEKAIDYPDGAVFAKIGFVTEKDPAFADSVVPSGAKRYQFMVRDKKKFADTDGWGYVLFNGEGLTFNGNPKSNSQACAACHHIVPDRGYVFSQMAVFSPFVEKQKTINGKSTPVKPAQMSFKTVQMSEVAKRVQRMIPKNYKSLRLLQGPLRDHAFEGTVNEIGPFLAHESATSHQPAALVTANHQLFAFAYIDKEDPCPTKGEARVIVGRSISSNKPSDGEESIVKFSSLCEKSAK